MLSIQGGEWGGRRLKALERKELRPTAGRVKSAIFSIIEAIQWKRAGAPDFSSWHCLDLFAGVGGLGLEILSRGAATCVFVEKNRQHAKILSENISSLQCQNRTQVKVEPVERHSWEEMGPFDLVLLDPPYAESELVDLLRRLGCGKALKPGGIVLFEHEPKLRWPEIPGLELHSTRKLGPAGISVFLRSAD